MTRILVFGGTTEGRQIAKKLSAAFYFCDVSVATEYGEMLLDEETHLRILKGRLAENQMEELCRQNAYSAIIDATHPFATQVSANIKNCAAACKIPLIRLERNVAVAPSQNCQFVETSDECAEYLCSTAGKILLTTGSKDLDIFCKNEEIKARLVVRVLPALESLNKCYANGLEGRQIIAMQGPFSQKMNETQIEDYGISILVTKESGKIGGVDEKIAAAIAKNISCVVIKNPAVQKTAAQTTSANYFVHHSVEETFAFIENQFGTTKKTAHIIEDFDKIITVSLVGTGMGNADLLTVRAKKAVENAQCIFGAKRLLETIHTNASTYACYLAEDIIPVIKNIQARQFEQTEQAACKNIAVLFSGDTGFYSGATKLQQALQALPNVRLEIIPGISSMAYLAAQLGITYQDAAVISLHGVEKVVWLPQLVLAIEKRQKTFMLTSGAEDVVTICQIVQEQAKMQPVLNADYAIGIGFNLSYSNEKITVLSAADFVKDWENQFEKGLYSVFVFYGQIEK